MRNFEEEGPLVPDAVTIKWRKDEPPYVEIRLFDTILVAGWVHPVPDKHPMVIYASEGDVVADDVHDACGGC